MEIFHRVLADAVLVTHVAFVAFVVFGLLAIFLGVWCRWNWIRNPWFRAAHLAGIGLVVVQAWLGIICPLTTLEMALRERGGETTYGGTFITHWLHQILFFEGPAWTFAVCYTLFGLAVVLSWMKVRPRPFLGRRQET